MRDKNGQALGRFYFEDEPGRRSAANLLTRDEVRRIAADIAKLPKLVQQASPPKDTAPNKAASRSNAPLRRKEPRSAGGF